MNINRKMSTNFTVDLGDDLDKWISARIEILNYTPGSPAPYCSNPSSAAYGDPGEPSDFNYGRLILTVGDTDIEVEGETYNQIIGAIETALFNKIDNIGEMAVEDRLLDVAIENHEANMEKKFHRDVENQLFRKGV